METSTDKIPGPKHFPTSAYHVEFDYFATEEYNSLLVVPFQEHFVIVCGNEHLGTLKKSRGEDTFWEVYEGNLDGELLERIGAAIDNYNANRE
jgi:hypothetical protein